MFWIFGYIFLLFGFFLYVGAIKETFVICCVYRELAHNFDGMIHKTTKQQTTKKIAFHFDRDIFLMESRTEIRI